MNIQWLNYSLGSYTGLNDHSAVSEHSLNYSISSLKLTDAGRYTCSFFVSALMSTNIIPSRANNEFTSIIVKIPNGENPSVAQLKPYYRVGDNIDLICSATYPSYITTNVNMQWLNSSNRTLHSYTGINNNTEHTISYIINNVSLSDAGQYTCQYNISSTNHSFVLPSDNLRTSVNVTVNGTIKSPKLIAISSSSLILSWSPPATHQSIPIIGYNYTCIGINVSYTMTGSVSNTSLSVTLLGLIPFRKYTCNVTAITRYGRGISANVNAVTDEAAPSKVTSLNVASVQSNTSFLIWWSLPNEANGIIANYTVTISHYDNNTVIHNLTTNNLAITVSTGLIEYIPYIISD
ncbi:PREDICTED: phosphatidylinositol phosphatase PTPRQ-like [Amphimedon queenslandica]|uniref:Fibronectin type-III domain-containing protein n=1 Tax=Amphimedon queenslandica TaxID=400682 RepID=A0AAN0JQH1_AMPQE|nr:PREDICTED: phosphatidylinositol phosphatase PTPRQ-like [Amphimedon queenslandica]|eukprot:XP_019859072.1 PREDICTED: phosphatidylinositol phosphatase PTPRQ-like [Amphimedon queenslandica]